MPKYVRTTPRITVQFIDAKTEEIICEVPDRNYMNVGDILTQFHGNAIVMEKLKGKKLPKKILVLTVSELILED